VTLMSRLRSTVTRLTTKRINPPAVPYEVEKAEWAFYIASLRPGMTVFDVGANRGLLTVLFSHFVEDRGAVHSFEPNPPTFERLSAAVAAQGCANVTLNHAALSDREGVVRLNVYDEVHDGWVSMADRPGVAVSPVSALDVPSLTVDAYCAQHTIQTIDLLKIDVEGAEYQVLLGAQGMLARKAIRCLLFEFGGTTYDMGNTPDHFEALFAQHGYSLANLIEGDPLFPGRENPARARFSMHIARPG
jgi:FkbM family methyltransferase